MKLAIGTHVIGADAEETFSVFPNPASGKINFQFPFNAMNIELVIKNILGNEIYRQSLSSPDLTLDISSWSKGIYFAQTTDENKNVMHRKIIIE